MLIATLNCSQQANLHRILLTYASVHFHQLLILYYQAKAEEKAAERKAAEKEAAEKAAEKKAAKEAEAKAAAAKAAADEKKVAAPAPAAPAPAAPAPAPAAPPAPVKAAAPVINKGASGASGVGVVKGGEAGGKVLQQEELSSGTLDFLKQYSN